jgi:hypothetical protein
VTAKQGEFGAYAYGARYGINGLGTPFIRYTSSTGADWVFSAAQFGAFQQAVRKPASGVVPPGFKVTESGNAPWYERAEVDRAALDALAEQHAEGRAGERTGTVRRAGQDEDLPGGSPAGVDRTLNQQGRDERDVRSRSSALVDFIKANPDGFTVAVGGGNTPGTGFVVAPLKATETIVDSPELTEDVLVGLNSGLMY